MKDILRNRVQILTKRYLPSEKFLKLSSITNSNSSQIFNKNNFNPLLYDFDFESFESQIYRVDGTRNYNILLSSPFSRTCLVSLVIF